MGLTTAFRIGQSGLSAHSEKISVIGHNIANVNTTAYKSSRLDFATQFSQTFSFGTPPDGETGGTNPHQQGLGVVANDQVRNLTAGSLSTTGRKTDLALEGEGYFMVNQERERFYTRAGNFSLNARNELITPNGGHVQGFGVNNNFEVDTLNLKDMEIPIGSLTVAEETTTVNLAGNLNADGDTATRGSINQSQILRDLAGAPIADTVDAQGNPNPAGLGTLLSQITTAVNDPLAPNGVRFDNLFLDNEVIVVDRVEKGSKELGPFKFKVSDANTTDLVAEGVDAAGTTIGEFNAFLDSVLGINTIPTNVDGSPNANGAAGVKIEGGRLVVTSNLGVENDITLGMDDIKVDKPTGTPDTSPFAMEKAQDADGESVRTSFIVFDSLGTPLTIDVTMTLEERVDEGNRWRFFAESDDDTDLDRVLSTGELFFDHHGQLVPELSTTEITIDRSQLGVWSPLTFNMNFKSTNGTLTSLADNDSQVEAIFRDGSEAGTLADFAIAEDGRVIGSFTNGASRTLGQVAIATFANPEGLIDAGNNLLREGPNSGQAIEIQPLQFGSARVVAGTLEQSNVDLSREFIDLILTQTGFTANTRVINTSDQLIRQLAALGA